VIALAAVACWGAAALLVGGSPGAAALLTGLAAPATAIAVALRRLPIAWLLLGVTIGAASTALHLHALRSSVVATLIGRGGSVPVELTLVRDPVELTSARGYRFVLAAATLTRVDGRPDRAPVTVLAHGSGWLGLLPSQRVRAQARIGPPRPGDPVAATVRVAGSPEPVGRPRLWQRMAGRVRMAFRAATSGLPPDERGLVPGLVIGDTAAMPLDLVAAFRLSGLTHVNAVSGENVAVVLATVGALLRRTWAGRRTRAVVSLLAILGFVVLARPSPSVLRAALMGGIVVAGVLVGRRGQPLPALATAVIALVAIDPFLARAPGFTLSVLATAAIVVAARPVADRLGRHMPRLLAVAVAVPLVAQIACTPVLVAAFGQLTPWAVPANVLAAPAVAPATVAGVACAVAAVPFPGLAHMLAWVAAVPAAWLAFTARAFAALPGAGWAVPPALAAPVSIAFVAVLMLAGVIRYRRLHAMLGAWPP